MNQQEMINIFFLGDKGLYEKYIHGSVHDYVATIASHTGGQSLVSKGLGYVSRFFLEQVSEKKFSGKGYLTAIASDISSKNSPELRYISFLSSQLDNPNMQFIQQQNMSLYQFLDFMYREKDKEHDGNEASLNNELNNRLVRLVKSLKVDDATQDNALVEYKKTLAYPQQNDYFQSNNSIHNQILDITTVFKLADSVDKNSLEQKVFDNTPLVLACKTGHSKAALMLIEKHTALGVDVNQPDSQGMTPLHWACFYRDEALINALLEAGARAEDKNSDGDTPLALYNMVLPENTKFLTSARDEKGDPYPTIFPSIPAIDEGNLLGIGTNEPGELKQSFKDIAFHMDKVAFHKLGVSLLRLNQEILTFQSLDPGGAMMLQVRPSMVFELFIFYHFNKFIRDRSIFTVNPYIVKKLETEEQKAEASSVKNLSNKSSSST